MWANDLWFLSWSLWAFWGTRPLKVSQPLKVSAEDSDRNLPLVDRWWLRHTPPGKFNLTPEKWWLEIKTGNSLFWGVFFWPKSRRDVKKKTGPILCDHFRMTLSKVNRDLLGDEKITNWITWYFTTWEVSHVPLKFAPEKLSEPIPPFCRVKLTVTLHQVHSPLAFKAAVARSFVVWGACEINIP